MLEQFGQAVLQRLGLGRLAAGDRELGQADLQLVGEDVEHVDRITLGVVALLAGLAVGGDGEGRGGLRQGGQPAGEAVAELRQGELRGGAAEGRGMGRLLAREA